MRSLICSFVRLFSRSIGHSDVREITWSIFRPYVQPLVRVFDCTGRLSFESVDVRLHVRLVTRMIARSFISSVVKSDFAEIVLLIIDFLVI